MSAAGHYREAQAWLFKAEPANEARSASESPELCAAIAQVHATLATAGDLRGEEDSEALDRIAEVLASPLGAVDRLTGIGRIIRSTGRGTPIARGTGRDGKED